MSRHKLLGMSSRWVVVFLALVISCGAERSGAGTSTFDIDANAGAAGESPFVETDGGAPGSAGSPSESSAGAAGAPIGIGGTGPDCGGSLSGGGGGAGAGGAAGQAGESSGGQAGAGEGGAAGAPIVEAPLSVARVWVIGQSLADGPRPGSPPPGLPLPAVPMWVRDGTGVTGANGQNFDAFTALQQPPGFGHGGELACGLALWQAGVANIQIKIAKGSTSIAMWAAPTGKWYPWVSEEVPQVLAASAVAFPGAIFTDHLVINAGQYEATSTYQAYALEHTYWIGRVRAGIEALLGHPLTSLTVELVRTDMPGGTWATTVRVQQLAVPGALFLPYDDVQLASDGLHPTAASQNIMGSRRAPVILQSL